MTDPLERRLRNLYNPLSLIMATGTIRAHFCSRFCNRRGNAFSAVTLDTPSHGQRCHLLDFGHGLDRAMALLTRHPAIDMATVVEEHIIGQTVNPNPLDGRVGIDGVFNFFDFRRFRFHHPVTIHAHIGGWNTSVTALLGTEMAIQAIHFIVAGMDLMGIIDRLLGLVALGTAAAANATARERGKRNECEHDNKSAFKKWPSVHVKTPQWEKCVRPNATDCHLSQVALALRRDSHCLLLVNKD